MNNITNCMTIIRAADADDAEEICAVCSEDLGYPCEVSLVRTKLLNLDRSREEVFAAFIGGKAVGFVHIEKYDVIYFETMANILGLAVKDCFRRKGVAKELMRAAEKWAIDKDIGLIRLNSGSTRTGAHKFYKAVGYTADKQQMHFTKRLTKELDP